MEPAAKPQSRKSPPSTDSAPRKRRKRTVVSGAADDCFTCARQGTKCDRRRPYCSQCLELGRECSGYKTTLTWGVGVASRGKLRGLSLPVTGSQPAATSANFRRSAGPQKRAASGRSTISLSPDSTSSIAASTASSWTPKQQRSSPVSDVTGTAAWMPPDPRAWPSTSASYTPEPPSWNQTYHFQAEPPKDVLVNSQIPPTPAAIFPDPRPAAAALSQWSWPSHTPEVQKQEDEEEEQVQKLEKGHGHPDGPSWMNTGHSPSFSQLLLARSVGRTPRLRYLISYYAEAISPMIVAFDSPTNPFRTHILRLAQESTSLQEAIATLSTSNLRQRRERRMMSTERTLPARMSSLAHRALTDESCGDHYGASTPVAIAQEEQYHRGMAVKALNMELADPRQRLSDSVLATLLILCLFHVCDTGVAQFKTQFAGVTKLLAIRMRNAPRLSEELKWFIRMFTWYDTMTATTNDREVQLRGTCLDIAAVSDGEWGLENLAGCDPGLFKLVAQLGRLNLLSQNQETSAPPLQDVYVPSTTLPPSMVYHPSDPSMLHLSGATQPHLFPLPPPPSRPSEQDRRPLSQTFWSEWFSYRQKLESWRLPSRHDTSTPAFETGPTYPITTQAYMSPPSSPSSHSVVAPENMEDVFHTSESFRHSAILYTERLAHPDLPSSHPRIQHIVHHTMRHILAVNSDVYLLWPLFITGSECVLQSHRTIIRQRCGDISKDSGFLNNLSCLELLEKIWVEHPASTEIPNHPAPQGTYYGPLGNALSASPDSWSPQGGRNFPSQTSSPRKQGFRWQEVMQAKRAEGEYMVV